MKSQDGRESFAGHRTRPQGHPASVGVDSCWVNFFDPDKMAEAFQLPENEEILTCLALGYPAEGAGPLANHNSRKPIEETVTYL